ncbi:MAG TPA: T9SS type A sorting domain-containing protein [Cyclobacteriaceae bacterium]
MKKSGIAILVILAFSPAISQSLKLLDNEQNWEGKIGDKIQATIRIQNISATPVSIVIQRVKTEIGTTQLTRLCWSGDCLEPDAQKLIISKKLEPGEITSNFVSILDAGLTEEFSIVSYHIYNKDNPDDAISFDVHYSVKEAARGDVFYESAEIFLRDIYPNPASENAFLDYQLKVEEQEVKIIIHNVLGSIVGVHPLSFHESQLKIPIQDLNPGVYFYTLYLNTRSVTTKKFVVKK